MERARIRGFYIFTIIMDVTHQIIAFKMAPTTTPAERGLSYNFTTFADVAHHTSLTCRRPVSRLR
jgi:hypothetical protein